MYFKVMIWVIITYCKYDKLVLLPYYKHRFCICKVLIGIIVKVESDGVRLSENECTQDIN